MRSHLRYCTRVHYIVTTHFTPEFTILDSREN